MAILQSVKKLLGLCGHKWKILHEVSLISDERDKIPYGTKYILQCEHCGDIKAKKI